jgi:hypothetical protein
MEYNRRLYRASMHPSRPGRASPTSPPAEPREQHAENRSRLDRLERLNRAIAQLNRDYDNDLVTQREILQRVEMETRQADDERDMRMHSERLRDLRSRETQTHRSRRDQLQRLGM